MSSNCKLSSLLASNENAWKFERQCQTLIEARNAETWGGDPGRIVEQRRDGRFLFQRLRRDDLDARFPGVIDAVLTPG